MSYDLINDDEQPPGPALPGISAAGLVRFHRGLIIFMVLSAVGVTAWWMINFYATWLWFSQFDYRSVYTEITLLKTFLFYAGALLAVLVIFLNFNLALRLSSGPVVHSLPGNFVNLLLALFEVIVTLAALIPGLIFGALAARRWETALLFLNAEPFGIADPQFGRDISFYVINLELIRFAQGWLLALVLTVIATTLALYAGRYALRGVAFLLTPKMLRHLAGLAVALMVAIALGHVASVYELTLSENGVVAGATYTDVHVRIPVYWFLAGIALLSAAGVGASVYFAGAQFGLRLGLRLMAGALSLWLVMFLLAGVAYPRLVQRFQVAPDEYTREEPFLQRHLSATNGAYGLDRVEEKVYPVAKALTPDRAAEYRSAIDQIRLWDSHPLQNAYNQLQFMELYYTFLNVDSDRYVVDGQRRQTLIGVRELDPANLPPDARRWVNQRLQYTHGYGVAMSPANGFTPEEGRPEFLIQDIPLQGSVPVSQPEIYYGETPVDFAIVNTDMREVNPNPEYGNYSGSGGVALSSWWRQFIYSVALGDINILLSDQINPESRIQYWRQVQQRVGAIAPFLKLDEDPYPALDEQGKLWWIQDAYTITDSYPYAAPSEEGYNYIRNSVKVLVDAYNGKVVFYVADSEDPLLRMYRRALPGLFQDLASMPPDLRSHLRYPITLFSVQAQMYLRYHVDDPQVFFNQAEQWDLPLETRFGKTGVQVAPTYLIMRLPGEEKEEFVLLMPFTPAGQKKNLVGWLAARNDPPYYGQLKSFHLPDDRQIDGPSQVEARIENDQEFSQQFTLWDGSGSEIIRGRLLTIPIADTIVYVEPLYLQSEELAFPELKKVILADNTNLVMADSMGEGLARLLGQESRGLTSGGGAPGATLSEQLRQLEEIEATVNQLEGNLEDLEESLENLRKSLGGNSE